MHTRTRTAVFALACSAALAACGDRHPVDTAPAGIAGQGQAAATAPSSPFVALPAIDAVTVHALGVDAPLKTVHFQDKDGEGLLVLARKDSQSDGTESDAPLDVVLLTATLYQRGTPDASFTPRWHSEYRTECEGLDLEAGYFLDHVQATDLDGDRVAELTLPSHGFCGGGVDPHQIVIELRRGNDVYRAEGESLVSVEGEPPFGGERTDPPSYAAAPPALRAHLDAVWDAVHALPGHAADGGH